VGLGARTTNRCVRVRVRVYACVCVNLRASVQTVKQIFNPDSGFRLGDNQ
jgi:hypothetical protein